MKRYYRRVLIGVLAGLIASLPLTLAVEGLGSAIAVGIVLGVVFTAPIEPPKDAYLDAVMFGGALGIPCWGITSLLLFPLLSGHSPQWDAEGMRAHFPALVGWVCYGALLAVLVVGLSELATKLAGAEPGAAPPEEARKRRIVILGGGFAGMQTAVALEQELRGDPSVSITLVSDTNALLFTPMLAEVAGSSLEGSHISTPLRTSLHFVAFIRAKVKSIDLERRRVGLEMETASGMQAEAPRELRYDQLVLALGSVSNYHGLANVEKYSYNFKSLLDAIRIRNHVIEMFERADRESDEGARRAMLTFVVAGGGFAGVELAGALNDFSRGILADYPSLKPEEVRVVLVHSRERILPELSESLGAYARRSMEARGVEFKLGVRLLDARPGVVVVSDGEIPAQTLVWTAGVAPNPLLATLPYERDKRGAVKVESTMAVPGVTGVWAVGDCAALNDGKTGKPCPPTAQFAIREAATLARNLKATLEGKATKPFHFDSLGALCVVGHQTACAELSVPFAREKSLRFSGLLAWLMWRGIYLSKLPGLERKVRVLLDWTIELFFQKDIVQTIDLS